MQKKLKIGEWIVESASGLLFKDDKEHRLEPKAMAVLVYLAENAGEIVTRSELEKSVWQGSIVTYEALTVTINKIRAALEDDSRNPRYIETLAKRGYRLIASVDTDKISTQVILTTKQKALTNLSYIISIVFVIFISAFLFYQNTNNTQLKLPHNVPSISVIPFANINNDPVQDYFAAGITEYLITDLSRLSNLLVTSRNSVLGFNSKTLDLKNIGETLNTEYVLTGSVLKDKNQIRIAAQLTDVSNGVQLWADRFDRKVDDLFAVQNEIINKIVTELVKQVGLTHQEFRRRNHTANHEAHDYYIRGNALYTSISKEGNSLAREMFLNAIEIDPFFSSAYSAIALTYIDDYRRKWGEDYLSAVDHAFEHANKALSLTKITPLLM